MFVYDEKSGMVKARAVTVTSVQRDGTMQVESGLRSGETIVASGVHHIKDGQKVKVGSQKLAWHLLDSETYNVKLFRFAEKWGQQTYGSLFWAVTVIDCPEEIRDVRLAAGSNGASMWWLNSQRITLKEGRNILRCAVINGPGLSDMCVRFLDEKGAPVTGYLLKIEH